MIWNKQYGGPGGFTDQAHALAIDSQGNVVVTGASTAPGVGGDIYTAKYAAATGALIWENRYNGEGNAEDTGMAVAVDAGGNVLVVGIAYEGTNTSNDIYLAKYAAADGALLWEKKHNGPAFGNDLGGSVAVDPEAM